MERSSEGWGTSRRAWFSSSSSLRSLLSSERSRSGFGGEHGIAGCGRPTSTSIWQAVVQIQFTTNEIDSTVARVCPSLRSVTPSRSSPTLERFRLVLMGHFSRNSFSSKWIMSPTCFSACDEFSSFHRILTLWPATETERLPSRTEKCTSCRHRW
jgi:hypothetical protein